jgi:predicted flap endonuclease-1-like 5' DNA nuclease
MNAQPRSTDEFDSVEEWDFDSAQIQPPVENPRALVSVAFNPDEFDLLATEARQRHITVPEFIRAVVLQQVSASEPHPPKRLREQSTDRQLQTRVRSHLRLVEIERIGQAYAERLAHAGVSTIENLLRDGASAAGRMRIAAESGIDERKLLEWINHADLMRIKGVGSEYADLLEAAGVSTVLELANHNAERLYSTMAEVNATKKLVRRTPSLSEVQRWVTEAKSLDRIVSH